MAHGLQDLIVELDRAWDEQGGVRRLARHVLLYFRLVFGWFEGLFGVLCV